jgi:hypothetical protein
MCASYLEVSGSVPRYCEISVGLISTSGPFLTFQGFIPTCYLPEIASCSVFFGVGSMLCVCRMLRQMGPLSVYE